MKQLTKLPILIVLLIVLYTSCQESDKFSTNPSLQLAFSRDTLAFDTTFTTIASPFQLLKVYNRNNNSISLESIEIANAEKSGFRINVQGMAGTQFGNVALRRNDSIYITVDAKLRPRNGLDALVRDSIRLVWNGNTRYIQLGAYGLDVEIWDDKTIDKNTLLDAKDGYYIRGDVTVKEGSTLTIEEGTTLYFDKKGALNMEGNMIARGTPQRPITLRGHRFDHIQYAVPYDNASDQWIGITVGANSFDNVLENVRIRNSQKGIDFLPSTPEKKKAILNNTIVHNTSKFGIRAVNCNIDAVNCQFTNSTSTLLKLIGGKYNFLHCTIANYYLWHPRTDASLVLQESDEKQNTYPLIQANFTNSIIMGNFKEELVIQLKNEDSDQYLFTNCLLQSSEGHDSKQFVNTVWDTTGVAFPFLYLNAGNRYYYSFGLTKESLAIDKALASAAQQAPTDLRGVSRLADGSPDIGCYEYIKK